MKRFLSIFVAAGLLAGLVLAATWRTGEGAKLTATTTHTKYAFSNEVLNTLSVYNSGTNDVFCLVNTTTNVLVTRIANNTALPIAAGASFTFDAQAHGTIHDIEYATTNGTSDLYLGGY